MIAREMRTVKQDVISEWARGVQAEDWWNSVLDTRPVDERIKEYRAEQRRKTKERIAIAKKEREMKNDVGHNIS